MILAGVFGKPFDPREQDVKPEPPLDYTHETPETIQRAQAHAQAEREKAIKQICQREKMKRHDILTLCAIVDRQGIGAVRRWLENRERMHP